MNPTDTTPATGHSTGTGQRPTEPTVFITPIRAAIPATGGTLEVLIRVQAPAQPETGGTGATDATTDARAPMRLALVVDRSGSMDGAPLDEALRCVEYIAGRLTPRDELAVVLYDDQVQVPLPLSAAGDPARVQAVLDGVRSGGSTDLHAGWLAGVRQLEVGSRLRAADGDDDIGGAGKGGGAVIGNASGAGYGNTPGGDSAIGTSTATGSGSGSGNVGGADSSAGRTLSRVILLSDGQANAGLLDPVRIERQCTHWLERGVSTTTVGLGRHFNEDLMLGMARAGGGQQYYGQTAADLFDGFDEELALLEAMLLRRLRLTVVPCPGVLVEAIGQVQRQDDGRYVLSDLAWAAESWLMLRLHVTALSSNDPHKPLAGAGLPQQGRALLSVTLQAEDMRGMRQTLHSPVLTVPALDASACNDLPLEPQVAQRLQELQFGDAAMAVRALLLSGDTLAARRKLAALEGSVADHPWLRDKLARLRELIERDAAMSSKELRFSARKMSSRLAASEAVPYSANETQSASMPAYLRRKVSEGKGRDGNKGEPEPKA